MVLPRAEDTPFNRASLRNTAHDGSGQETGMRHFSRFYRSIDWARVFGPCRFLPHTKVNCSHIDRPRHDG